MPLTLDQWYADQLKYSEMLNQEDEQNYGLGSDGTARGPDQIYHPKTKDDYDKIPPGGIYVDPQDGEMYKKAQPEQKETQDVSNLS